MQSSSVSSSGDSNNNNRSTFEKNKQLVERFLQTIKSDITRVNSLDYINGYMRHWHLYEEEKKEGEVEEEEEEQQHPQLLLLDGVGGRKQIKKLVGGRNILILFTDMIGCFTAMKFRLFRTE